MIVITGASGFIGRRLVQALSQAGGWRIKALSRQDDRQLSDCSGVEVVAVDLSDPESLKGIVETDCVVVNLVYLWQGGERKNLEIIQNLLDACLGGGARRLVHVSTAAVVGRVPGDLVTEETPSNPVTEYGVTKLKVERLIEAATGRGLDTVTLRPTAVFGPAGDPLKAMVGDLLDGNPFKNYAKACLFAKRRTNLVHIDNVVAAIAFVAARNEPLGGEAFIVSDDDAPQNNYFDVENTLRDTLGLSGYGVPRILLPLWLLQFLLTRMGRNNPNPRCSYVSAKLEALGFSRPMSFAAGLMDYAKWCKSQRTLGGEEN